MEVAIEQETVWLNQTQMCDLFGRDQSVISLHIRNVFKEGEVPEVSNMQKMHIAESDKPVSVNSPPSSVVANFAHTARAEIARTIRYFRTVPVQGCRSSILELVVKGNPKTPGASKPFEVTAVFEGSPERFLH